MSVEINVASFTDSSVIQLAGDYLADYGGIFITAGGKVRFKYKQNDNFFENEVDITLNTWHRVEQFRTKLLDKVKINCEIMKIIHISFSSVSVYK